MRTLPLSAPTGTPDGIAVGADGTLFVADYGGGAGTRVLRVDRHGRVTTFAARPRVRPRRAALRRQLRHRRDPPRRARRAGRAVRRRGGHADPAAPVPRLRPPRHAPRREPRPRPRLRHRAGRPRAPLRRERRRGDSLTVAQHYDTRPLRSRDTLHLDARTLRPLARRAGPAERRAETRYAAGRIRLLRPTGAGTDTLDVADVAPGAFGGAAVDAVVAALPLRDGHAGVLPLLVGGQRGIVRGEVRARRAPDAPEPAWDVRVAYPSALVTVRVAERGRRVLGVEYDYGARRLVLARVEP